MKKVLFIAVSFFALACAVFAAEKTYPYKDRLGDWVYQNFTFKAKKGNLDKARDWNGEKLPTEGFPRCNIPGGAVATLDGPYPAPLSRLFVGCENDKKSLLLLKQGAVLSAGALLIPDAYATDSAGEVRMTGGELSVGNLKEADHNGSLFVGAGGTVSGTGHFIFSDGTLAARLLIGGTLSGSNVGTFSVEGSLPHFTTLGKSDNRVEVRKTGTLEFILDEAGVASLDLRKSSLRLQHGATIRVNGAKYNGPTKTILLVETPALSRSGTVNLETAGFSPPYQATISYENRGLTLRVSKGK